MKLKIALVACFVGFGVGAQADFVYVNGKALYPYVDRTNADLSDADFQAADLTGANLTGANLSYSICNDVIFSGADLNAAILTNANFNSANFTGAILTGTRVQTADFTAADFSAVVSGNITGSPAALPVGWQLVRGYLIGPAANLNGADLSGVDLSGINLNDVDLAGADLRSVVSGNITGIPAALPLNWQLIQGYLVGPAANLSGADLSGINLTNANVSGVNLSYAVCTNATLSGTDFTGADLSGTDLSGADLGGIELSNADLGGANLRSVRSGNITGTPAALPPSWQLIQGYLIGPAADLRGADLTGADLTGVDLAGADLTGANLDGADVSGTWLEFSSKTEQELIAASSNKYTLAEIIDIRPGSALFAVSNGMAKIGLGVETSTNLIDWAAVSNTPAVYVPVDSPVKFFRYSRD